MRVKVQRIDHDGFCGREPHPHNALIGQTGLVLSSEAIMAENGWPVNGPENRSYLRKPVWLINHAHEQVTDVFRVLFADGSVFEMIDFEVEVVK